MNNFEDEYEDDGYINEDQLLESITPKSTVVLSIYSKKGLEDVIEGYDEVVKALNKWKLKNK